MAVFRSDQAQVTFAAEAAQGGDLERLMWGTAVAGTPSFLDVSANPGDLSITVDAGTSYVVGDFIRIGDTEASNNSEVRRVEYKNVHVLHLDRPLAFQHTGGSNNATSSVKRITGASTNDPTKGRKYITFLPGVYETVDVPDPEMAIEARYFLGTNARRNFFQAYKGQQSFNGSMGDMVLLNGWPLRFPIGGVVTIPHAATIGDAVSGTNTTHGTTGAINKGDMFFIPAGDYTSGSNVLAVGDYIVMDFSTANSSLGTPATKSEVRCIAGITATSIEVDYPFMFAHGVSTTIKKVVTSATGFFYRHHILEQVDLDTISWHVHMRDSGETAANDFDRRYVGGMVGSMTITAEEGGLLTVGWDGVPFMDMLHNQRGHTGVSGNYPNTSSLSDSAVTDLPGYALMQKITAADVNKLPGATSTTTAPDNLTHNHAASGTTEPYYFSRGSLKFSGTEFARIRSFSFSVTNNEEARYYIKQRFGRHRGPNEIREQQREYTLTATVALPDTAAAATSTSHGTATALFKELLLEGDYGSDTDPNMKGFSASLEFVRGTNDKITIDMPGLDSGATAFSTPGTPSAAAEGGNNQGIFLRTAPHSITGDNPLQAEVDALVRNITITVDDGIGVYP